MRTTLLGCTLLLATLGCHTTATDERAPSRGARPHVLLILADDLGYADLGFTGCADIPTPNLDRLAAQGVVCTDGHVSASGLRVYELTSAVERAVAARRGGANKR